MPRVKSFSVVPPNNGTFTSASPRASRATSGFGEPAHDYSNSTVVARSSHALRRPLYATWPMRVATHVCYARWRECGPLAAVDAENRSLRKGSTPPGSHVVTHLLS